MPATKAQQIVSLLDTTRKRREEEEQKRHEAWRQSLERAGVDVDWLEKQPPIIKDIVQGIGLPMRSLMQTPPGRFVERASQVAGEQVLFAPGQLAGMQGGYVPVGHPAADIAAHYTGLILGNIAQYGMGGQLGRAATAPLGRIPQLARLAEIAHPALRTAGRGVASGLGVAALQSALYPEELKPTPKDVAQTVAFHAGAGLGGDVALIATRHMLPGLHPLAEAAVAGAIAGLGGGVATLPFKEDRPALQHLKEMGAQMASMAIMRTVLTAIHPETWEHGKQFTRALYRGVDAINKTARGLEMNDERMVSAGRREFVMAINDAYHHYKRGVVGFGLSPEEYRSIALDSFRRTLWRMGYRAFMPETGLVPTGPPRPEGASAQAAAPAPETPAMPTALPPAQAAAPAPETPAMPTALPPALAATSVPAVFSPPLTGPPMVEPPVIYREWWPLTGPPAVEPPVIYREWWPLPPQGAAPSPPAAPAPIAPSPPAAPAPAAPSPPAAPAPAAPSPPAAPAPAAPSPPTAPAPAAPAPETPAMPTAAPPAPEPQEPPVVSPVTPTAPSPPEPTAPAVPEEQEPQDWSDLRQWEEKMKGAGLPASVLPGYIRFEGASPEQIQAIKEAARKARMTFALLGEDTGFGFLTMGITRSGTLVMDLLEKVQQSEEGRQNPDIYLWDLIKEHGGLDFTPAEYRTKLQKFIEAYESIAKAAPPTGAEPGTSGIIRPETPPAAPGGPSAPTGMQPPTLAPAPAPAPEPQMPSPLSPETPLPEEVKPGEQIPPDELWSYGEETLEDIPPEDVQTLGGERPAGGAPLPPTGEGEAPAGRPYAEGTGLRPGVGDSEGGPPAPSGAGLPEAPESGRVAGGRNYIITDADEIGAGGEATKLRHNIEAIRLLKQLEAEGRPATREEQAVLVKYVGWGGLSGAFHRHSENKELKSLLTPEEWESARQSTKNAHYTNPPVIRAMYDALVRLGYKGGGRILEPAVGVGHFFGLLPPKLAQGTRLTGIELDSLTGRIAKMLYPEADIRIQGFEEAQLVDNFFDVAISNVPFGNYGVFDPRYERKGLTNPIHNYFFVKALDKVRPGGIVAFITSRYTMDSKDPKFRLYLSKKAEFLGAIRLPDTAFKASAGTEVVTDIIFLRKLLPQEKPTKQPGWIDLSEVKIGVERGLINEYFAAHPEMVLGEHSLEGSMYGPGTYTVKAKEGVSLADALAKAIAGLPENVMTDPAAFEPAPPELVFDDQLDASSLLPGAFMVSGNTILQKDPGTGRLQPFTVRGKPVTIDSKQGKRIKGLIDLYAVLMDYHKLQYADAPEEELTKGRAKLNQVYDAFVAKHGPIRASGNASAFGDDPRYGALAALEVSYTPADKKKGTKETAVKADIFTKRTLMPFKPATKADSPKDALLISLAERGAVDLERMAELVGMDEKALIEALQGEIFLDPASNRWEIAEAYLSGNVRLKLAEAKAAAKTDPAFKVNVEALEKVQPKDLGIDEIYIKLGAPWIPGEVIRDFVNGLFGSIVPRDAIRYLPETGNWIIDIDRRRDFWRPNSSTLINDVWGAPGKDAIAILRDLLKYKLPVVWETSPEGKRTINREATMIAREKAAKMEEEFAKFAREKYGAQLAKIYNERFNSLRVRQYNGEHIVLPGSNPAIQLRPHQKNAVWRILQSPNTLIAHEVGAGKTFTLTAAAMEMRRLGLARKPMIVVPNHLVGQWANEVQKLYPAAKVLVATDRNFSKAKRRQFLNQIVTGDWDMVIVRESHFAMIPMSKEYVEEFYEQQLDELEQALVAFKGDKLTVKELVKAIERLRLQMKKRLAALAKDPGVIPFDQLGVDALLVDEAHRFKNLMYTTSMGRVAGLGDTQGSAKSFDLWMKSGYISKLNGGRGVVFATGTPVTNSMAELYTMTRYMRPDILEQLGVSHFDAWASTFGQVVTTLEVAPEGGTYRPKERFSRFKNVAELLKVFYTFADVQTAKMIGLERPALKGGKRTVMVTEAPEKLKKFIAELGDRAEAVRKGEVMATEDNMLKITSDGRKAALDLRLVDPEAADLPDSKVNAAVQNIYDIHKRTEKDRLTQLVFLDLSVPRERSDEEIEADVFTDEAEPPVVVYEEIKQKLIEKGVRPEEIAFIHEAKTMDQRQALFKKVRDGEVRILIGSTERMGAGTNVQDRVIALHHLDVPWRPADIEQREGRALRPGNQNPEVEIIVYVTRGSFDEFMWDTVERKATFINQLMSGNLEVRELEDIGEMVLSAAEVKALASGNPALREHVQVMAELRRLQVLEAQHRREQQKAQEDISRLPDVIAAWEEVLADIDKDLKAGIPDTKGDKFRITLGKRVYTERKEAEQALRDLASRAAKVGAKERIQIGDMAGFAIYATEKGETLILKRNAEYPVGVSIRSIEYRLANLAKAKDEAKATLSSFKNMLAQAKEQLDKPFPYADKLQELDLRRAELEAQLQTGEWDEPVVAERLTYEEARRVLPPEDFPADVVTEPPIGYVMDLFNFAKEIGAPARSKELDTEVLGQSILHKAGVHSAIELQSVEYVHTLAHELGHHIDFILSGYKQPWSLKRRFPGTRFTEVQLRKEAVAVSLLMRPLEGGVWEMDEYRRKLEELMADVYHLYLLDPDLLEQTAPSLYEAINTQLKRHPQLEAQLQQLHLRRHERTLEEHPDTARMLPGDVDLLELIPEDIRESEDPDQMLRALIVYADRLMRFRRLQANQWAEKLQEQFSEEELEDMGAYIEGISNLRTGKPLEEIKASMTPAQHKAVAEYRYTQEHLREQLNRFVEDAVGPDYIKYLEDYLAHFYISTPKQRQKFVSRWTKKVRAAQRRVFPTLKEAMEAGFIPVTQNIAELQKKWVEANWRAAINLVLIKELAKVQNDEGLPVIMKPKDAPAHWPIIHHPAVARYYATRDKHGTLVLWEGGAAIDPDAYRILRQILERPFTGWGVPQLEALKAWIKKCQLSFSLFFHMSIVESLHAALPARLGPQRSLLLIGKDFQTGIDLFGLKITRPHIEGRALLKSEEFLKDAIMHGVTLGGEFTGTDRIRRGLIALEHKARAIPGADYLVRKLRQFNDAWDAALWDRLHLGSKAYAYYWLVGELMTDMPPDASPQQIRQVKETVAQYVNNNFGGQEWVSEFWLSPQSRQLLNLVLLAPDWTLSQLKMGFNTFAKIKDPTARKLYFRHWRNLLLGLATGIAIANYALVRRWPWQNEPGRKWTIDVTPIMKKFPWNEGQQRRWYIAPGKQARELLRWVTDPLVQFGNKLSPLIRIATVQLTGHQPGSGFPAGWMREDEDLSFYEQLPERIRAVMSEFVPFAWSGTNFMWTWPMSRGMGVWQALRSYEDLQAAQVDPKLYQRLMPKQDYERLKAELDAAVAANGLDPAKLYKQANTALRTRYYSRFWAAVERQDEKEARRLADILRKLGATRETLQQSGARRDIDEATLKSVLGLLPGTAKKKSAAPRTTAPRLRFGF